MVKRVQTDHIGIKSAALGRSVFPVLSDLAFSCS